MSRMQTSFVVGSAFVSGFLCATLMSLARADGVEPRMPFVVHLPSLNDESIGPVRPGTANVRSRVLYSTSTVSVSLQAGDVSKHLHRETDEIQYVLEGSGTFWLGETKHVVGPGDLIVIPRGTAHAGGLATTGRFKAVSIKSPPQRADDVQPVD